MRTAIRFIYSIFRASDSKTSQTDPSYSRVITGNLFGETRDDKTYLAILYRKVAIGTIYGCRLIQRISQTYFVITAILQLLSRLSDPQWAYYTVKKSDLWDLETFPM